jgi:hypothetical protein
MKRERSVPFLLFVGCLVASMPFATGALRREDRIRTPPSNQNVIPPRRVPPNHVRDVDPSPDAACSDETGNRFVDCGNGTVTDTQTGLIWLKNASCFGEQTLLAANTAALEMKSGDCGLGDHSTAGLWRLPTADELVAIRRADCSPSIPNSAGNDCYWTGPWATDVMLGKYWSTTQEEHDLGHAWTMDLSSGDLVLQSTVDPVYLWPVRAGH